MNYSHIVLIQTRTQNTHKLTIAKVPRHWFATPNSINRIGAIHSLKKLYVSTSLI